MQNNTERVASQISCAIGDISQVSWIALVGSAVRDPRLAGDYDYLCVIDEETYLLDGARQRTAANLQDVGASQVHIVDDAVRANLCDTQVSIAMYASHQIHKTLSGPWHEDDLEHRPKIWTSYGWLIEGFWSDVRGSKFVFGDRTAFLRVQKMANGHLSLFRNRLQSFLIQRINAKFESLQHTDDHLEQAIIRHDLFMHCLRLAFLMSHIELKGLKRLKQQLAALRTRERELLEIALRSDDALEDLVQLCQDQWEVQ